MVEHLIRGLVRLRGLTFVRILQRTLVVLFPFAIIGAFAQVIALSFLSVGGFFGSIMYINHWLPHYAAIRILFHDISELTLGMLAIYGAFAAAKYTAKYYDKDDQLAGYTGALTYAIIFYHRTEGMVVMRYYGYQWLITGIIIGFLVGLVFRRRGPNNDLRSTEQNVLLTRSFSALLPIMISVLGAVFLHTVYALIRYEKIDQLVTTAVQTMADKTAGYLVTMAESLLTVVLGWFGFSGPLTFEGNAFNTEVMTNLSTALSNGSSWKVPYPYTAWSIYHSFGTFGGTGATLALVIGILVTRRQRNSQLVGQWSLIPSIFNANDPVMIGIPLLLNPSYLVPFTLVPLINMLIASALIWCKLMPPVAYPVPTGTPGPLIAFIGTNGDWRALLVGILILFLDVWLYLPFIWIAEQVDLRYAEERPYHD